MSCVCATLSLVNSSRCTTRSTKLSVFNQHAAPVPADLSVMKWGLLSLDVMLLSRIRCCPRLSRCFRIAALRLSWSDCRLSKSPRLAAAAAVVLMVVETLTAPLMEVRVLGQVSPPIILCSSTLFKCANYLERGVKSSIILPVASHNNSVRFSNNLSR